MILRGHDGVGATSAGTCSRSETPRARAITAWATGGAPAGPTRPNARSSPPGPTAPSPRSGSETFREGTELAEAILFLEKAIQDGAIDGPLAAKVNRYLDERSECFRNYWYERGANFDQSLVADRTDGA